MFYIYERQKHNSPFQCYYYSYLSVNMSQLKILFFNPTDTGILKFISLSSKRSVKLKKIPHKVTIFTELRFTVNINQFLTFFK